MSLPEWVELRAENYRIVVDQKYCNTVKDMERLAESLNELFEEHKNWKDTYAKVDYNEIEYCKLCHQKYTPYYDESRKEIVCANCGKGKLEWALEKLRTIA